MISELNQPAGIASLEFKKEDGLPGCLGRHAANVPPRAGWQPACRDRQRCLSSVTASFAALGRVSPLVLRP
jgi:hypothetical protein